MSALRDKLFQEALRLDDAERAALAGMLIDSIDKDVEEGVEAAWIAEIERRVAELDAGTVETIPWEVVRDDLHRKLGD